MKSVIVLHHSADPFEGRQFDKINSVHRKRGFPKSSLGYYGGYHYLIERDGTVGQFRQEDEIGAHTNGMYNGQHANVIGIGICLAGDFTKQKPTEPQLLPLYALYRGIVERRGISTFILHKDVKATSCPGTFDFREAIDRLHREYLEKRLAILEIRVNDTREPRRTRLLAFIERIRSYLYGHATDHDP